VAGASVIAVVLLPEQPAKTNVQTRTPATGNEKALNFGFSPESFNNILCETASR
jgi:hypothetical protein